MAPFVGEGSGWLRLGGAGICTGERATVPPRGLGREDVRSRVRIHGTGRSPSDVSLSDLTIHRCYFSIAWTAGVLRPVRRDAAGLSARRVTGRLPGPPSVSGPGDTH